MSARRLRRSLLVGGCLDRYVMRLFALSYLAAFFLVVGLFLIIDMASNLDDYLRPDEDGRSQVLVVLRFYALQLPFLYLQVSPFVTLVAGLFAGVRMSRTNEVVAALNAGVSARRLFAPFFVGAAVLALGMFGLREWASGTIGRERDTLHDQLVEGRRNPVYENFWVPGPQGRDLRVQEYRPAPVEGRGARATIRGLSSPHFGEDGVPTSLTAQSATWSPADGHWKLEGGRQIEIDSDGKRESEVNVLEGITPSDVELAWKGRENPLERSFSECLRLLERDPRNARYRTLFHYHLSFPLAGLVLLAVGLPFVVGQERGRAVERVAVGLILCVFYFGLEFVSRTLGMGGQMGPILASWLPVIFFGSLGVVLFGSIRS